MSFRRYESYRDSGVEWLGEVPVHWRPTPLKYLAAFRSGGTPSKETPEFWGGDVPWASAKDLKMETLYDTADHLSSHAIEIGAAQLIPANSVLVLVRGMMLARTFPVCVAARSMAINQDLKALIASTGMCSNFLAWALRGTSDETLNCLEEAGHGTKALRMDAWTSLLIAMPPASEQPLIAAFIDRETAKIDILVEEQRRLIELLEEKRQAAISQAVTKGLDPSAPMKDSGVEWLGEVPMHWEVRSIASCSHKITNGYVGPTRDILREDGVRYLQSLHIKGGKIIFDPPYYVSAVWSVKHDKSNLRLGDVLIVQTGDIGQTAAVTEEFVGCNCHALIIVAPVTEVIRGDWLELVLRSDFGRNSLLAIQTGALHPHLNCGNVKSVRVPIPPLSEQQAIHQGLRDKLTPVDRLIAEAEAAIALLQERRSALISAAVTGKIDVREFPAAKAAEAA